MSTLSCLTTEEVEEEAQVQVFPAVEFLLLGFYLGFYVFVYSFTL